jgi:hypothetical protein
VHGHQPHCAHAPGSRRGRRAGPTPAVCAPVATSSASGDSAEDQAADPSVTYENKLIEINPKINQFIL